MSPTNGRVTPSTVPLTGIARRAWIKYQLSLRGQTLSSLARKHGLSRKTIQKALDHRYPRMERLIARALHMKPAAIWPERYENKSPRRKAQ